MVFVKSDRRNKLQLLFLLGISCGLASIIINTSKANAADKIRLVYGPFNCYLSVESLKTYAETGEITPEFKPYTKFLNQQSLLQLRHWLQKDFERDVISIRDYTHSSQGEELLQEIGTVVTTHSERNGFYALRAALIEAAANTKTDDWTILDVIQQFPTEHMQINTQELFKLKSFWEETDIVKK
jgi:hypothetical protein